MKELLLKYGFIQTNLPNAFIKHTYNAIISKNNTVSITRYTPKIGRYLDCTEYENIQDLEEYLKKNHHFY